ncbi:MAG: adenylate/guanylate cyclase domain-containing protein, partial [Planctomycetota bacterium]
ATPLVLITFSDWVYSAQRALGTPEKARAFVASGLEAAVRGKTKPFELYARRVSLRICVDEGDLSGAEEHLRACEAVAAGGDEVLKNYGGVVAQARAYVAAARGDMTTAEREFPATVAALEARNYSWSVAEAWHDWGRFLLRYDDQVGAIEKFDKAIEQYRRMSAGTPWIALVMKDKLAAQGVDPSDLSSSIHAMVISVQSKQTDFGSHAGSDGSVTLMFSDMVGFTEMTERLGDPAAHEVIKQHHAIVREHVAIYGGRELELQGDGFLLAFSDTVPALRCAVGIQRAFLERNTEEAQRAEVRTEAQDAVRGFASRGFEEIHVRIGLHTGEAIADADKFFGKTVILASRIASQAAGDEILVSADAKSACGECEEFRFQAAREVHLKGLADTYPLYCVGWDA